MYKVFIDTSDRFNSIVRLSHGAKIVDEVSGEIDVVTKIRDLLEKHDLTIDSVAEFEMNEGPGSFTGLRIGAAIVNGLNFALGKNVKPIVPKYQSSKFD